MGPGMAFPWHVSQHLSPGIYTILLSPPFRGEERRGERDISV